MGDKAPAEQGATSQGEQSAAVATNHAPTPTGRRHILGRGGLLATGLLSLVVALGGGNSVAASQLRPTHQPRPQTTEQPTPPIPSNEHLVPTNPQNCEPLPWEHQTSTQKPVGDNSGGMVLASVKKPAPEKTQGTKDCWIVAPDGTRIRTTTPRSHETPVAQPTTNPQQI